MPTLDPFNILPSVNETPVDQPTPQQVQHAVAPPQGPTGFWGRITSYGTTAVKGIKAAGSDVAGEAKGLAAGTRMELAAHTNNPTAFANANKLAKKNAITTESFGQAANKSPLEHAGASIIQAGTDIISKANKQFNYLSGPTATGAQRKQIITDQTNAAKNSAYVKLLGQYKNKSVDPASAIAANRLAANGAKTSDIKTLLDKSVQAGAAQNKKALGDTLQIASLVVSGPEIKQVLTSDEALSQFMKAVAINTASGAAGNVGSTLSTNPNASKKELVKSSEVGGAFGAATTALSAGAQKVAQGLKAAKTAKAAQEVKPTYGTPVMHLPQKGVYAKLTPEQQKFFNKETVNIKTSAEDSVHLSQPGHTGTAKEVSLAQLANESPNVKSSLQRFYASVKNKAALGESGTVAPGQAVADAQALVDKYSAPTKYSKDIQTAGHQIEGVKNNIQSDTLKAAKGMPKLTNDEKRAIQDFRDAKEAGLPTPKLSAKLSAVNDQITALNTATFKALDQRDTFAGIKPSEHPNPETYTHREVQGKGSPLEQIAQGSRKTSQVKSGFGKTVGSEKGRVFQSITDSAGNRQVVAVKNESFGTIKHVYTFDANQNMSKLGKFTYDSKAGKIVDAKGNTYKLGQATVKEIETATNKKYIVDPVLTSLKNYSDARTAAENYKFIESLKQHPDFEKFAAPPNTTAPKNWKQVSLLQFAGYKFQPKVAEALNDIAKHTSSFDEPRIADQVGNILKRTIVYFPLKHDLNMGAAYAVDRGLSAVANPASYYRGAKALVQAFHDVTNQSSFFQDLQARGFNLVSSEADKQRLNNYFQSELKNVLGNKRTLGDIAKQWGSTPDRMYKSLQNLSVWQVQDILNVARVRERMSGTLLGKGQSLENAIKNTEKFAFQYRVPTRVGGKLLPGKLGRSASRLLQSRAVFFGPYTYDKYKIISNAIKDTVNLKSLVTSPRQNFQAIDKLAAMAVGAGIVWPLIDKGVQKLTGNPNAHVTAPGPLAPVETALKIKKGQESITTAATSQVTVSPLITDATQQLANTDSFTGKKIADPNASLGTQMKQRGQWLASQIAPFQKVTAANNAKGNKAVNTFLSLAGVTLPKNSPQVTKLYSLQYDTLPGVQAKAKTLAKAGNFGAANQIISQYDRMLVEAAKQSYQAEGKPVPSDAFIVKELRKSQAYYAPKQSTIRSWQTKQPANAKSLLGL